MANPRKFSEKIASHLQKQAEETAAFEQIMRDVAIVTNKPQSPGGQLGSVPRTASMEWGSEENRIAIIALHKVGNAPGDIYRILQPLCISRRFVYWVVDCYKEARGAAAARERALAVPDENSLPQYGVSPDSGGGGGGPAHPQHQGGQAGGPRQGSGGAPGGAGQPRGRPAGVGPMRARPMDRKIDTSPYGSTAYLSPPPDSNWRRTNSDSALHQSSAAPRDSSPHHHHLQHHHLQHHHHQQHQQQQGGGQQGGGQQLGGGGGSPLHYGGGSYQHHHNLLQQGGHMQQHQYSHSHHALNTALLQHPLRRDGNLDGMISMLDANPNRPRSSCEVPRVPGIHIYPSAHESGGVQIPVSSSTGSLPDLTSVHFPPSQLHAPSLEREPPDQGAGTPYSNSPASTSPATLSPTSVAAVGRPSPHHSPRHSPHGSPTTPTHYTNHQQNHLSVPNTNTRYLHHSKGVTLESTWMQGSYQQECSPPSLHSSHSNINMPSPTMGVSPVQVPSSNGGGYRSPRSPGSSPGGAAGATVVGGNSNGGGGGGGDSPHYDTYAHTQSDNYYINQALQHHFEQFSMDWAQLVQSLLDSGVTWTTQVQTDSPATTLNYINNVNTNQTQFIQATLTGVEGDGGGGGGGGVWAGGGPCLAGPAPNTPTTIPDIILTDFSNSTASGEISKDLGGSLVSQLNKELSASMGSQFDTPLFPEDEGLRDSLGTIDFDGFQMLTDPGMNVISDPSTEDVFRQDRL